MISGPRPHPHHVPLPRPHGPHQPPPSLSTHSFKLYLHLAASFLWCLLLYYVETCSARSCLSLPSPLLSSTVAPALFHWFLLRFLRSARIWVNRCSVVTIFIAFFKFRLHTTRPVSRTCASRLYARSAMYRNSTLSLLLSLSAFSYRELYRLVIRYHLSYIYQS
jgi:hypothetical protein